MDLEGELGDSGGPIVTYKGNDKYSLVGILKVAMVMDMEWQQDGIA